MLPRIKAVMGDKPFTLDWMSIYKFTCAKLDHFVHGRMIFAGDSAHVVSPFGARGGNGGIQDIDNLCWKLAAVIRGDAGDDLLETYDQERRHGSEENILNSSRATNFMTPKSEMEATFRNETLLLAETMPFARRLVNSGRLSEPCSLEGQALQTPAKEHSIGLEPGAPCLDAPLVSDGEKTWLLNHIGGSFLLLTFGSVKLPDSLPVKHVAVGRQLADTDGFAFDRYGDGVAYLVRPDQHVAARFDGTVTDADLKTALERAGGRTQ